MTQTIFGGRLSRQNSFRGDIQVFRGLSVVAVVLYHAFPEYFASGFLGVDAFFVISGFVVTPLLVEIFQVKNASRKAEIWGNFRKFYLSRFVRLAPPLAVVVIACSLLFFLLAPTDAHSQFAKQSLASLFALGNFGAYAFSGDYFSPLPNPMIHTWSLSVEEQIYFFLPLMLFIFLMLFNRFDRKSVTKIFLLLTLVGSFCFFLVASQGFYSWLNSFLPEVLKIGSPETFSFYSPIERLWEFSVGGLVYFLPAKEILSNRLSQALIGLSLVVVATLMWLFHSVFDSSYAVIFVVFASALIIWIRILNSLPSIFVKLLSWIGDRSYSLYLWHMPLIFLALYSTFTVTNNKVLKVFWVFCAVALTTFLGHLTYAYVEAPLKIFRRSRPSGRKLLLVVMPTVLLPFISLQIMFLGISTRYWGLGDDFMPPPYAGALDTECARDSPNGGPCIYLAPTAAATVLLIGDSHAGHLSEVVVETGIAHNLNVVVWTNSDCPVVFTRSTKKGSDKCVALNLRKLAWLEKHSPNSVIVSEFLNNKYETRDLVDSLALIKLKAANLLLVQNSPVFPDEFQFMVPGTVLFGNPYKAPKVFPLSKMNFSNSNQNNAVASFTEVFGIPKVDLSEFFCDSRFCTRFRNGTWLYRDDDHFSVAGANLTAPFFNNYFSKLVISKAD